MGTQCSIYDLPSTSDSGTMSQLYQYLDVDEFDLQLLQSAVSPQTHPSQHYSPTLPSRSTRLIQHDCGNRAPAIRPKPSSPPAHHTPRIPLAFEPLPHRDFRVLVREVGNNPRCLILRSELGEFRYAGANPDEPCSRGYGGQGWVELEKELEVVEYA